MWKLQIVRQCKLPANARVTKGYLGSSDDDTISNGDEFLLLYTKKEHSFECKDRHGRNVLVPRTDDLRFFKLNSDSVAGPEQHADYDALYTADELVKRFSFPVTVRLVSGFSAGDVSGSSAFALVVRRQVVNEYLIIATKDMILTQLPIDLDVEFEMINRKGPRSAPKPPISPRSPTGGAAREAFWHEQMNDDEETYVSSWSEADDDDSIYQSVADYQDMQTIGGKGAARVGKFSSYATVDLTGMSTADKKLQVAQENLQKTREKGHNEKSPVVKFWAREIGSLQKILQNSSAAPSLSPLAVHCAASRSPTGQPPLRLTPSSPSSPPARGGPDPSTAAPKSKPPPHVIAAAKQVKSANMNVATSDMSRRSSSTNTSVATSDMPRRNSSGQKVSSLPLEEQKRLFLSQQQAAFREEKTRVRSSVKKGSGGGSVMAAAHAAVSSRPRTGSASQLTDAEYRSPAPVRVQSGERRPNIEPTEITGTYKMSTPSPPLPPPNTYKLTVPSAPASAATTTSHYDRALPQRELVSSSDDEETPNGYSHLWESVPEPGATKTGVSTRRAPTKAEVIDMDVDDVCRLLSKLGLDRFAPVFESNFITGSMFLQLDDEMLKEDLGMTKKFDRLKVLQFQSKTN